MRTIWKANAKIAKMPPYQAEATDGRVAFGANQRASIAPTNVRITAKTNGSGMTFSNRYTKKAVARPNIDCFFSELIATDIRASLFLRTILGAPGLVSSVAIFAN